jgi:tRNA (adenine57-N1/adenine58-N1)-methyltransferase
MIEHVKKGDIVVLIDSAYRKFIIHTDDKTDKYKGVGVIDPKILVGKKLGQQLEIGNKKFWILKPSLMDKLQSLKRNAQIILPKDAALIIMNCCIESGNKVIEAGIGSGSLTIALANAVAPGGTIISYEIRDDFIKHAKKNLKNSNTENFVKIKKKDITKGIEEKNIDAVILDIPDPWNAVEHAWNSLKIGGYICTYSPLISQVEKTVENIKKKSFIETNTIENIQREMIVSKHGTRPSFNMLGHTGYLTFARKIL